MVVGRITLKFKPSLGLRTRREILLSLSTNFTLISTKENFNIKPLTKTEISKTKFVLSGETVKETESNVCIERNDGLYKYMNLGR